MITPKTAAIAGLTLGLAIGGLLTTWVVFEVRSRQAPIEVDYLEEA